MESQSHNEFLHIHPYIHIYHCQVCICCFYCLEGYNCILWTENNKWLSQPRSTTSSILYTSDLLYWYGYFFYPIFLSMYALFYHSYLQKNFYLPVQKSPPNPDLHRPHWPVVTSHTFPSVPSKLFWHWQSVNIFFW